MNNGLTPFSSDSGPLPGQQAASSTAGKPQASSLWQQSTQMDFFGGDMITVSPTETPFWSGVGAAMADVAKTFGLHLASLLKRP
ncbi:MAG TPA: hypothetical protein V6C52_07555 [Coleofasciculaceae cyanobacterium]|jgi:hypothetical protein